MAACRSEKHFFLKFKSAAKTLKKYLTNHINLTKFAFFPNVLCQNYGLSNSVVFVFVYDNRAVNEHEDSQSLIS